MAIVTQSQARTGTYVPTTFIVDVAQLNSVEVTSPEFKELLVRLYQNLSLMSNVLNLKETGYYLEQEVVNSQSWFPNPNLTSNTPQKPTFRQGYTTVVVFDALPNADTVQVAHDIDMGPQFVLTYFQGTGTDQTDIGTPGAIVGIPIPYPSAGVDNTDVLELWMDSTNVYIKSQADYSAYSGIVTIKYLKQ